MQRQLGALQVLNERPQGWGEAGLVSARPPACTGDEQLTCAYRAAPRWPRVSGDGTDDGDPEKPSHTVSKVPGSERGRRGRGGGE